MLKHYILIFIFVLPLLASPKNLKTNKITSTPVIDGIITKNEWTVTDSATNYIQIQPQKGEPASEITITWWGARVKSSHASSNSPKADGLASMAPEKALNPFSARWR